MTDFRELVDPEGIGPEEELRLRKVHDLLVQAGPPPDLPPALERAPSGGAEILQFPLLPRRRVALTAVLAAALALMAFGGGYLTGNSKSKGSSFEGGRVVALRGQTSALAILRVARRDSAGNWPMQLEVTGLPRQADRDAYYELWLTKGGRPAEPCGTFRVNGKTTRVRFTVPYDFSKTDGWAVTRQSGSSRPGPVLLSS